MNTEDDTFAALKKIPYNEMEKLYDTWFMQNRQYVLRARDKYIGSREELFKSHGWTHDEYFRYNEH